MLLLPPMGQCEPACQVKNANELFRHMLHMINVVWECARAASGDNKKLSQPTSASLLSKKKKKKKKGEVLLSAGKQV